MTRKPINQEHLVLQNGSIPQELGPTVGVGQEGFQTQKSNLWKVSANAKWDGFERKLQTSIEVFCLFLQFTTNWCHNEPEELPSGVSPSVEEGWFGFIHNNLAGRIRSDPSETAGPLSLSAPIWDHKDTLAQKYQRL